MKAIDIARFFKISKQKVNYWLYHPVIEKRKKRTKLNRKEINILVRWAREKPINLCSAKKIQNKFNLLSKKKKRKRKTKESFIIYDK